MKSVSVVIFTFLLLFSAPMSLSATLTFSGNPERVWSEKPQAATGLEEIYMLSSLTGVTASIELPSATSTATVTEWGAQGASYATDVPASRIRRIGKTITISDLTPDAGYTITIDGKPHYYWIIDYSRHEFSAVSLAVSDEQECGRTWLRFDGSAAPITYHGINARSWNLSREIELSYTTLAFDSETFAYTGAEANPSLESISNGTINVAAPLCDTYFTLTGDRFLRFWGREVTLTSPRYTTTSIAAEARATQTERDNDNEVPIPTDGLGGSAPVEISFSAAITDAALFHEWQFSDDPEFSDISMRSQQLEMTRTFNEMGTVYARFVAANGDGSCQTVSETFTIFVGESYLKCPNVFSPGSTEGVNDLWKVSYKSITSFECHIFNRWGQKMTSFTDPSQGWDGRYNGKLVPAGAYYYVIKAVGSDNKKYNLSGDINIVKYTGK